MTFLPCKICQICQKKHRMASLSFFDWRCQTIKTSAVQSSSNQVRDKRIKSKKKFKLDVYILTDLLEETSNGVSLGFLWNVNLPRLLRSKLVHIKVGVSELNPKNVKIRRFYDDKSVRGKHRMASLSRVLMKYQIINTSTFQSLSNQGKVKRINPRNVKM